MKKNTLIITISCAVLIFIFFNIFGAKLLLSIFVDPNYNTLAYTSDEYKTFYGGEEAASFLPEYEDLTGYQELYFGYYKEILCLNRYSIESEYMVKLKYSDENREIYQAQKEDVLSKYKYTTDKIEEASHVMYSGSEIISSCGSFDVHYLKLSENDFPRNIGIILSNDETLEIIYLFYYETWYDDEWDMQRRFFRDFKFDIRYLEKIKK